ncbi:MAG: DNA/RNA non-specific endonuclease, partial [Burkholderiaceae bacterium]|nr:DNA/RNA non-specific endonuclease [Burkholderiaceae bacterium]
YAMRARGDVYVLTGPVFEARPTTIGENKVWVPKYLFKLVYDPSENKRWAYWVENIDNIKAGKPITYEELVKRTGIQFFTERM